MDVRSLNDVAPPAVLPIAQALAVELGCEPVVIAEADRPAYGEAIATAAEFSASEEQAVAVSRRPPAARRAADARSEVCIVSSVRLMGTIVN